MPGTEASPQVLLGGEGQKLQVCQGPDVLRLPPYLVHALAVERHQMTNSLHHGLEALELQGLQPFSGQGFMLNVLHHRAV